MEPGKEHGLEITCRMKAKYQRGRQAYQYLRMTSIVNPHTDITFEDPDGEVHHWPRGDRAPASEGESIKPHPRYPSRYPSACAESRTAE